MLFKSQLLTQASGSVGGVTASRNSGGMYFRARAIPTDPNTQFQADVRNNFVAAVSRWASTLTQGQRDDWEVYAQNVTLTGPLGDQINVSGFNMYVRANVPNLQASLPLIEDAPDMFNLGEMGEVSFTAAELLNGLSVTFDDTQEWANIDDGALLIYISRPQNPTINFFKGPFRFVKGILGNTTTPPTSPDSSQSPFTQTAGQNVFMKVRAIDPDGRLTSAQILGPIQVS